MTKRKSLLLVPVILLGLASAGLTQAAEYVLPVVVSGVAGLEGSYWDSEVRIVKRSYGESVTVRRSWVALPGGGGFQDDAATAPSWDLPAESLSMIVLFGTDLLAGLGVSHAAVGLEIEGEADVYLHAVNTEGAPPLVDPHNRSSCLPGQGQLLHAWDGLIVGESRATWVTAGSGKFRANLGLVNPNSVELVVGVHLYTYQPDLVGGGPLRIAPYAGEPEGEIVVPPWGWVQVDNVLEWWPMCAGTLDPYCWDRNNPMTWGALPFAITLQPESSQSYYGYLSLVYSPKNDPEFVPLLAGGLDVPIQ